MSRSDHRVKIILMILILLYLSVLISGFSGSKGAWLTTLLNLVSGLSVIIYWAWKQIRIQQHFFELREIIVLCFEIAVIGSAVFRIVTGQWNKADGFHGLTFIIFLQYIFFGIHLLSLGLFLIFMLTFKLKKLI